MTIFSARDDRPRFSRWWAVLTGSLLALALVEGGLRLLPPVDYDYPVIRNQDGVEIPLADIIQTAYENAPGQGRVLSMRMCYDRPLWDYYDADGCVPVDSNSLGLRDKEIGAKKPGEYRVLALGDSFTFGMGVRAEDTWVEQLEGLLRAEGGAPTEVINAGFAEGAHDPVGYAEWLLKTGLTLDPDVVVVGFCLNDIHPHVMMAKLPPRIQEPWLSGWSQVARRLQAYFVRRGYEAREARNPEKRRAHEFEVVTTAGAIWSTGQKALRRMQAELDQRGIRFVVAVLPMMTQLSGDYPYDNLHAEVARFCAQEGIERVDLLVPMLEYVHAVGEPSDAQFWVHPTDQHPTPAGHRVFARGIHEFLRKTGSE